MPAARAPKQFAASIWRPRKLAAEHLRESGPSRIRDAARQATSDHSRYVELFNHDDAVALGQSCRLDMQDVFALTAHLTVQAHHATFRLFSVFGSFLFSRHAALGASRSLQCALEMPWIGREPAIGIGVEMGDASVEGYDGLGAKRWIDDFDFAQNRRKPLVTLSAKHAGLRSAFDRAVHDDSEITRPASSQRGTCHHDGARLQSAARS